MLITDHINLIGANPLSGPNEDRWGPRFVDQTQVYDPHLRRNSRRQANTAASTCAKESMRPWQARHMRRPPKFAICA